MSDESWKNASRSFGLKLFASNFWKKSTVFVRQRLRNSAGLYSQVYDLVARHDAFLQFAQRLPSEMKITTGVRIDQTEKNFLRLLVLRISPRTQCVGMESKRKRQKYFRR